MKKKSNNKKPLVALVLLLLVGVVGGTFAYFSSSAGFENLFETAPYNVTYEEEFVSPDNWTPGTTTDKVVTVTNNPDQTDGIPIAVRFKLEGSWSDDTLGKVTNTETGEEEDAVTLNFGDNEADFILGDDGYYYYNKALAPNESVSFLESVTFNKYATDDEDDATCVTTYTYDDGTTSTELDADKVVTKKSVVCTGAAYADETYTLDITAETVQYDAYADFWETDVVIAAA